MGIYGYFYGYTPKFYLFRFKSAQIAHSLSLIDPKSPSFRVTKVYKFVHSPFPAPKFLIFKMCLRVQGPETLSDFAN
jgi:hypothetical protein